jgi:hypothetical protein
LAAIPRDRKRDMRHLIILFLFILTGCHPLFCNWDNGYKQLTIEPKRERVVGQFKLIESSKKFLIDKGFKNQEFKLDLFDNGQFKFTNGPDILFDRDGNTSFALNNKEGRWSVSCGDSYNCMIELENVCVVPLAERDGRLAILITIGDGDECNGVVYEKIEYAVNLPTMCISHGGVLCKFVV